MAQDVVVFGIRKEFARLAHGSKGTLKIYFNCFIVISFKS